MIKIIKEIDIEVTKPNIFQAIVAKQYDMNTRFLKVTLKDCGTRIDVPKTETTRVVINAERKDGQSKGFDGEINNDGTVTVPLHSWMLELDGTVNCDISVIDTAIDDDKRLTTTSFTLLVEKAAYGGNDITSDPQYDVLVSVIEESKKAVAQTANALKGNKSGEIVLITDVSPIEHNVGVKVVSITETKTTGGTNYLTMPYLSNSGVYDGVEVTINEDGSILLNGTVTGNPTTIPLCKANFPSGKTYTYGGLPSWSSQYNDIALGMGVSFQYTMGESEQVYWVEDYNNFGLTLDLYLWSGAGTLDNLLIKPYFKDEEVTTVITRELTQDELAALEVKRLGKNLCELGTVSFTTSGMYELRYPLKAGITYRISALIDTTDTDNTEYSAFTCYNGSEVVSSNQWLPRNRGAADFTPSKDVNKISFSASTHYAPSVGDTAIVNDIMIVPKGVLNPTDYEPFIEPTTHTPNENGIVEGVTSLSPSMTLVTNMDGVTIDAEYNRDINKAFAELQNAIITLGGTL